jgi:hypothetical protein
MKKMQISETKEILRRVALIDNRKVSPETIEAWHGIIGSIPFEIAQEALKLAQQDGTIKYLVFPRLMCKNKQNRKEHDG